MALKVTSILPKSDDKIAVEDIQDSVEEFSSKPGMQKLQGLHTLSPSAWEDTQHEVDNSRLQRTVDSMLRQVTGVSRKRCYVFRRRIDTFKLGAITANYWPPRYMIRNCKCPPQRRHTPAWSADAYRLLCRMVSQAADKGRFAAFPDA